MTPATLKISGPWPIRHKGIVTLGLTIRSDERLQYVPDEIAVRCIGYYIVGFFEALLRICSQ
jgi:hypothetical protein